MSQHVEIRNLTLEEVTQLAAWAGHEGWNPSPDDAGAFFAADPQGFIGCFVEGELASGISAVAYGETFGFIGLYITRPNFRGRGFGLKVWNAGISRLAGRTIGLDGVPAQQANYEKMGFRRRYSSTRWSGIIPGNETAGGIRAAISQEFPEILSFDKLNFPEDRTAFLSSWLAPPRETFVAHEDGRITGYAVIRKCLEGHKVGPLFARDGLIAQNLLNACSRTAGAAPVHLDVPDEQVEFARHLKARGFQRGFETARMYLGAPPVNDMRGVFAVTTLELG
ncbi:GNAT superfamily N-acetyltransferase [Rhizobium aquaticum]|uniref:GNAT superfamily N-acetyltransferase n=1 Tax=Rhizobium aquaticum TaxID=1549636 RepID=A0ABV2J2L8_9HYPH